MELREYLSILWRRKLVVAVTLVVTVLVTLVVTELMRPEYQATALIRVFTASTGTTYDLDYSDRLMNTYSMVATSRPMLSNLALKADLKTKPQVSVQALANSELMQIAVTYPDPALAARAANTLAALLIAYENQTMAPGGSASPARHATTVVQPAYAPSSPISPRKSINLAVGFLLGLIGGIGLAALFENLDPRSVPFGVNPAPMRDDMTGSFEDALAPGSDLSGNDMAAPRP